MNTYTFLTENYNEDGITRYFAISAKCIETLRVSETYDRYGQLVSSIDAGDSLILNSKKAVDIANKLKNNEKEEYGDLVTDWENGEINNHVYTEYFNVNDYITAYENSDIFDAIIKDCKEGEDYTYFAETCKGFNYWDGNNYKTITTEVENGEASHTEISDENLINELNEAIENMSYEGEGYGTREYSYKNYNIIDSAWQGTWEDYEITLKSEVED